MVRSALVTGGASGIGRECVHRLHADGYAVWSLDVGAHTVPAGVTALTCDVTSAAEVAASARLVGGGGGSLDVLVNCAGVGAQGTVEEATAADWDRVLRVNVIGVAQVCAIFLPLLRRGHAPSIINLSSIAAWTGLADRAVYSASKGAVQALTLAMAADCVATGVRVNAIAPATVRTPWVERLLEAADDPITEAERLRERQPTGRLVEPAEVAAAVAYLADAGTSSTTGTVLAVDGGTHTLLQPPTTREKEDT